MIDIVCRSLYPALYNRMKASAHNTACGEVNFYHKQGDTESHPTKDWNDLAKQGSGDIIVFVHDDIVFHSTAWDSKLLEMFAETDYDILGVVGCKEYNGGMQFDAGRPHTIGKYISDIDGKGNYRVKVYSSEAEGDTKVFDGCFIAVRREYFEKEQLDEALSFFVETDYCLRSKCGIVDILVGHYKIPELYGDKNWPVGKDIVADSKCIFYAKHGLKDPEHIGDRRCAVVDLPHYYMLGQCASYKQFTKKYPEDKCCHS